MVYVRASNGVETLIGSNVATVSRQFAGSGVQVATWNCPARTLATTDAIVITETVKLSLNSSSRFITEQLNKTNLEASTWTFYRYTEKEVVDEYEVYARFRFGGSYNSRVEGIVLSGASATPVTVNAVVAAATNAALAPAITAQQNAAITGAIADTQITAISPAVKVDAVITAVNTGVNGDAISPVVVVPVTVAVPAATVDISATAPAVSNEAKTQATSATATAQAPAPAILGAG
ncbi:hypothetical protein [Carboxydothermus hydrogenoformans]|nr:hypothetical protein [Carboxydothermus hydrogenoformans]